MQKVDLEYQHIANITPIKNIVICKNKESTEYFLENVYQHFIDCIVVSADKTYPLNPSLNSKVFDALENDNTLNLIVINADSINNLNVKTQKILLLDDIFLSAWRPLPYRLKITPQETALLISSFCKQTPQIKGETNVTEIFNKQKPSRVDDEQTNWIKGLFV